MNEVRTKERRIQRASAEPKGLARRESQYTPDLDLNARNRVCSFKEYTTEAKFAPEDFGRHNPRRATREIMMPTADSP
jgi:hypothetical protein